MAAGTAMEPIIRAAAEGIAARELRSATDEFSRVVERHRPQIFRFLLASTRDLDLAETLTQECFLKAHRNWGSFRGESSAMTWLMRIAINLQKDHWRNRRMQFWRLTRTNSVDLDEASEWLPSGESSVELQLLARERVDHVWRAVKMLPTGTNAARIAGTSAGNRFRFRNRDGSANPARTKGETNNAPATGSWKKPSGKRSGSPNGCAPPLISKKGKRGSKLGGHISK